MRSTETSNRNPVSIHRFVPKQVRNAFHTLHSLLPYLVGFNPKERLPKHRIKNAHKQFVKNVRIVSEL